MYGKVQQEIAARLEEIAQAGLFKKERVIETPQQARVGVPSGVVLVNASGNVCNPVASTVKQN